VTGLVAHGIGGVKDLPVPTWLFFWGAAVVLVVSFLALGALWKTPLLGRLARGRPAPASLTRVVLSSPVRVGLQLLSVALFLLVVAAALVGDTDPSANLAPTWVYVAFWLGLPLLSVLLGDVWRVLSPWRALADGFVWAWERSGRPAAPLAAYPPRLGRYPAAAGLFGFAALELAYSDPSSPRALAVAIAVYTYVTLFGMVAFGRATWSERGEAFAVLFHYFARMSAFAVRDGRVVVRWPLSGLAGSEPLPGSTPFLAVMLGTVAFDGFGRTRFWQDLVADIESPFVLDHPTLGELAVSGSSLGVMVAFVGVGLGAYLLAVTVARRTVNAPRSLVPDFVLSLVPIALAYEVAHYFSLFVIQGQFLAPILSDPLGRGWDLFGTADVMPDIGVLSANTIWYVQALALVAGHVAGLAVAHDRAVTVFREREAALRSQYAILGLMVVYTVGGLWLLSRG
jgi:hypothetical protein